MLFSPCYGLQQLSSSKLLSSRCQQAQQSIGALVCLWYKATTKSTISCFKGTCTGRQYEILLFWLQMVKADTAGKPVRKLMTTPTQLRVGKEKLAKKLMTISSLPSTGARRHGTEVNSKGRIW